MPEKYKGVMLPAGFQKWMARGLNQYSNPYAVSKAILKRTSKKGLRELVCEYKMGVPFKKARSKHMECARKS